MLHIWICCVFEVWKAYLYVYVTNYTLWHIWSIFKWNAWKAT